MDFTATHPKPKLHTVLMRRLTQERGVQPREVSIRPTGETSSLDGEHRAKPKHMRVW